MDLRRPRELRVSGGLTFVDEARCLEECEGGARQAICCGDLRDKKERLPETGRVQVLLANQEQALLPRHTAARAGVCHIAYV